MADVVDRFAQEALRFCEWVRSGTSIGPLAAREALLLVTQLYSMAITLPPLWCDDRSGREAYGRESSLPVDDSASRVAEHGGGLRIPHSIYDRLSNRLPLKLYGEVFNPLPVPPEEPLLGDLADDLADIFVDLETGLRHYEESRRADAVWEWGFSLAHHWGEHATSAIRALHCYLAATSSDLLSSPPE